MWTKEEIETELKEIKEVKKRLKSLQHEAIDKPEAPRQMGYGYLTFINFIEKINYLLSNWAEELEEKYVNIQEEEDE
jgi:hypothetical protein